MYSDEKMQQLIALRNGDLAAENANEYWSEEDSRKAKKMFEEGYGISDIALELKRTEVSVTCHLQNQGLFAKQCRPRMKSAKSKNAVCLCKDCKVKNCPAKGLGKKVCDQYLPDN